MYWRSVIVVAAAALGLVLLPAPRKAEGSELPDKLKAMVKKVKELLTNENQTTVAIGEFTGPPPPPFGFGAGIQSRLVEELAKLEVRIDQKSSLTVKGEYLPIEGENKEDLILRVVLNIRNKMGKLVQEISEDLPGHKPGNNEIIVKTVGIQVDLSKKTKASHEDQNHEIKRQMETPPLKIDDCKVKTSAESPYAVEVLVRGEYEKEFKLVTPVNKDGKGNAFVPLKRGHVYKLRLHNNTKYEAAASVTIDGVDAFQFFEPAAKRPGSFLVKESGTREVTGWTRGTESENEFLVGAFSKSAAAQVLKSNAKLGTIVVCFKPCWTGNKPPAEYDGSRSVEPNGTGLGNEVKKKTNVMPRTLGPLVASIVIRYNK